MSLESKRSGARVVYVGNLAGGRELESLASFFDPCTLFVGELAHVDPESIGRFLSHAQIDHAVMTHFHP